MYSRPIQKPLQGTPKADNSRPKCAGDRGSGEDPIRELPNIEQDNLQFASDRGDGGLLVHVKFEVDKREPTHDFPCN